MSAQNMDKLNKLIQEKSERKAFLSEIEAFCEKIGQFA